MAGPQGGHKAESQKPNHGPIAQPGSLGTQPCLRERYRAICHEDPQEGQGAAGKVRRRFIQDHRT